MYRFIDPSIPQVLNAPFPLFIASSTPHVSIHRFTNSSSSQCPIPPIPHSLNSSCIDSSNHQFQDFSMPHPLKSSSPQVLRSSSPQVVKSSSPQLLQVSESPGLRISKATGKALVSRSRGMAAQVSSEFNCFFVFPNSGAPGPLGASTRKPSPVHK